MPLLHVVTHEADHCEEGWKSNYRRDGDDRSRGARKTSEMASMTGP
jgi:hypothetical protein